MKMFVNPMHLFILFFQLSFTQLLTSAEECLSSFIMWRGKKKCCACSANRAIVNEMEASSIINVDTIHLTCSKQRSCYIILIYLHCNIGYEVNVRFFFSREENVYP